MNRRVFADWAIAFNDELRLMAGAGADGGDGGEGADGDGVAVALPDGYRLMNPFAAGEALAISGEFYRRFYDDERPRRIIFGINPGRHGAGLTGVPFSDSKQLAALGIDARGIRSFEPSAAFIYRMIARFGGAEAFYRRYYINSPAPLGLLRLNDKGNWVNANYYDSVALRRGLAPLIDYAMARYGQMPIDFATAYCLGQGQNYRYLGQWNRRRRMFGEIVPLAHPRYIAQYRARRAEEYIADYLGKLR